MQERGDGKGGRAICLTVSQVKLSKEAIVEISNFVKMESLGTIVEPR